MRPLLGPDWQKRGAFASGLRAALAAKALARVQFADWVVRSDSIKYCNVGKAVKMYVFVLLFIISVTPVFADVTCKENPMTTKRVCKSEAEYIGSGFYFFATDDTGTKPGVLFRFGGLISASRPDGVMVKLDDGAPFKITAMATEPDVSCRGRSGCRWSVGASANITNEQSRKIASSSVMLVSFTQGEYVSEPIEADPKKIGSWFQQWNAIREGASVNAQ